MIEQVNIELLKLQDELQKLKGASEQIAQAGKISKEVIKMGQDLTEKYRDVLKKLQTLVSDYMNKTYKITEESLTKLYVSFQERLKEEEEILTKFTELSAQSEEFLKNIVKDILAKSKEQIDRLTDHIEKVIQEQKEMLKSFGNKIENTVSDLIYKHEQSLEQEQKILESYLELAETTAKLTKVISDINFPKRLDSVDQKLLSLNNRINGLEEIVRQTNAEQTDQLLTKIGQLLLAQEELYEKVEKNRKKIIGNKILLWLIFIINLIFYGSSVFLFMKMFSDILDLAFK